MAETTDFSFREVIHMSEQITINALFDLSHTLARPLFERFTYPWEVLPEIKSFILALGPTLPADEYELLGENIWAARSAVIAPSASITGPCIIGPDTEVRHCAFIRGSALIGSCCVVGNSTELKNVILFDNVQVPHYNYVGDSVLGYKSHMGAGSITSNVKSDRTLVSVHDTEGNIPTGLKKMGAVLGDGVEIGCNSVLNPGTIVCAGSSVYPLTPVRGVIPPDSICKAADKIILKSK